MKYSFKVKQKLVSTILIVVLIDLNGKYIKKDKRIDIQSSINSFLNHKIVFYKETLASAENLSKAEIDNHINIANKLLATGQLADALSHYHSAIDADSKNYMTYFRRATVYLALGKFKSALDDLNQVITLKPDFTAARLQRGNVYFKQGRFQEATEDYQYNV
jgi:DnaJ homolog subfamily C member 3